MLDAACSVGNACSSDGNVHRSRIGFGRIISFAAIFVIHGTFSYVTSPSFIPSPFFPIYVNCMHRTKHGSDSGVYDTEGRFVPIKFEGAWECCKAHLVECSLTMHSGAELFTKYDAGGKARMRRALRACCCAH